MEQSIRLSVNIRLSTRVTLARLTSIAQIIINLVFLSQYTSLEMNCEVGKYKYYIIDFLLSNPVDGDHMQHKFVLQSKVVFSNNIT